MCLPTKPFKVEAEFEHAGLKCAVTQNMEGANRCGYVRVPPSNPAYGMDFEYVQNITVHGGLTFGELEPCEHEDGQGWWFGFDCAHAFDAKYDPEARVEDMTTQEGKFMLQLRDQLRFLRLGHYWTHEEVMAETMELAEQLAALAN